MANVAWAYAKFGVEPKELFEALAQDVSTPLISDSYDKLSSYESTCSHAPQLQDQKGPEQFTIIPVLI